MKKYALILPALLAPLLVFAQPDPRAIGDLPLVRFIEVILLFIDYVLVPLVFALALIAFLWGVFNFFIAGGADEEKREKGKQFMVWGIIGFFVMVSVWGIVNLFVSSFGFDQRRPDLPAFDNSTIRGEEGTDTFGGGTNNDQLFDSGTNGDTSQPTGTTNTPTNNTGTEIDYYDELQGLY